MLAEEEQIDGKVKNKRKTYQTIIYVIYLIMIGLNIFMFGARICSLMSRVSFRENISTYPTDCSSWTGKKGCTRISIY